MALPLEGLRVIALSQGAVIPRACSLMGQFGADVIKVESTLNFDFMRVVGRLGVENLNNSPGFNEAHCNQRSMGLNIKSAKGVKLLRQLIAVSDVVAENNRGHVMQSLGLNYENVCIFKPDIIYVSSQIFGRAGPYEDDLGGGPSASGLGAFTYLWGHLDDPGPTGGSIAHPDFVAGIYALMPVLAALDYRRRTGQGQYIDMAQSDAVAALMGERFLEYTINGQDPLPHGNRSSVAAPHGAYPCRGTDSWCAIAVRDDDEWKHFCGALGNPDWTRSPKFSTLVERLRNVDELDQMVEKWTRERTPGEVMQVLQGAGVPAGPVQNAQDYWNDPHLRARNAVVAVDHPCMGARLYLSNPIRMSGTPAKPKVRAPLLGEHTEEICREVLGLPPTQIQQLIDEHVLEVDKSAAQRGN